MKRSDKLVGWSSNHFRLVFHMFTGKGDDKELITNLLCEYRNADKKYNYEYRMNFERRVLYTITGKEEYLRKDRLDWPYKVLSEIKNLPELLSHLHFDVGLSIGEDLLCHVFHDRNNLIEKAVNFPELPEYIPNPGVLVAPKRVIYPEATLSYLLNSLEYEKGIELPDRRFEVEHVYWLLKDGRIPMLNLPIITKTGFDREKWIGMITLVKQRKLTLPEQKLNLSQEGETENHQMYPNLEEGETYEGP